MRENNLFTNREALITSADGKVIAHRYPSFEGVDAEMMYGIFAKMQEVENRATAIKYNDGLIRNIDRIIINPPATIIFWQNGNKEVVKCMEGDTYDVEQGIAMCLLKGMLSEDGYRSLKKMMHSKHEEHNEKVTKNNETENKKDES